MAPTNEATDEDKDDFYNSLQSVIDKLQKRDVNIIMGDLNAMVGEDNSHCKQVTGKRGHGQANNGKRLVALCSFNHMVIGGTIILHKQIDKAS